MSPEAQTVVGSVDVDGARLEARWWGPGPEEAPTLVLLHEGLGCVAGWRDFPERLAERTGLGVFAYSRQGYGGSSPCPLPRPLTYMHDEARRVLGPVLEQTRIEACILVGHSDGGSIAAIHAAETKHRSVRGLVLIAPHFFVEPVSVAAIAEAKRAFTERDLRSRLQRRHGRNVDCAFWGWNDAWLDPEFRSWDLTPMLPRIDLPVLVAQGLDDPYGTMAQVRAAKRGCSGPVTVLPIERCGHLPHRQTPQTLLNGIAPFALAVLDPGGRRSSPSPGPD